MAIDDDYLDNPVDEQEFNLGGNKSIVLDAGIQIAPEDEDWGTDGEDPDLFLDGYTTDTNLQTTLVSSTPIRLRDPSNTGSDVLYNWDGIDINSSNSETFTINNSGSGAMNLDVIGTITSSSLTLTGLTAGSILFLDSSLVVIEDNSNLFWDDVNNRLGVGNNTPTVSLDITGDILLSGIMSMNVSLLSVGDGAGDTDILIDGAAGQTREMKFMSGGSIRFTMGITNDAESGSNAGSDFVFDAYDDAGIVIFNPIWLDRSSGFVGINTTPTTQLDVGGDATISGIANIEGNLNATGGAVFNELGVNVDFRIEGENQPGLFLVDASADIVKVKAFSTGICFLIEDASGNDLLQISSAITRINVNSIDMDFSIHGDSISNLIFVNAGTDSVGFGTNSPSALVHIDGNIGNTIPSISSSTFLVVSNTVEMGDAEISIIANTVGTSILNFGDSLDEDIGHIRYSHSTNSMQFVTNTANAMRLNDVAALSINSTAANAQLDVNQDNTSYAKAVLKLTQLDIDQPFVELVGDGSVPIDFSENLTDGAGAARLNTKVMAKRELWAGTTVWVIGWIEIK